MATRDDCFRAEAKFVSMADMRRKAAIHNADNEGHRWVRNSVFRSYLGFGGERGGYDEPE